MTEDEKRQQKAMLLLEYHEAEQNLAHLAAKAASTSRMLTAVSAWLKSASKENEPLHDEIYMPGGSEVNILKDPQVGIAMDFDAARKLVQDIRAARARVCELYSRKQSLGLN